jgi:group I intron endonuclease
MKTTFIYTIADENGNIRYVGKSNNPQRRLHQHLKEAKGSHKYNWLQSIINRGYFPIVEILEEVSADDWEIHEIYWISQFRAWEFNLVNKCDGGVGTKGKKLSDKQKNTLSKKHKGKKLSDEHKLSIANGVKNYSKKNPNYNKCHDKIYLIEKEDLYQKYIVENLSINECKEFFKTSASTILANLKEYNIIKDKSIWQKQCKSKTSQKGRIFDRNIILQYDLEGNLISKHSGIKEAARSIDKNFGAISRCCLGKAKTAYGYIWKYEKDRIDINQCVNNLESQKLKKIYQYDLKGNFIAEYKSLSEAKDKTGIKIQTTNKSSGNFIWKYYKSEKIDKYKSKQKINEVIQFDLNENFIAEYESMEQAAKLTNSNSNGIYYCCIGKYKYSNNFIWKFKNKKVS